MKVKEWVAVQVIMYAPYFHLISAEATETVCQMVRIQAVLKYCNLKKQKKTVEEKN